MQLKHQVHFQPIRSSSSKTEGTQLKCTVFLRFDNVQKKCIALLASFLGLFASTVTM